MLESPFLMWICSTLKYERDCRQNFKRLEPKKIGMFDSQQFTIYTSIWVTTLLFDNFFHRLNPKTTIKTNHLSVRIKGYYIYLLSDKKLRGTVVNRTWLFFKWRNTSNSPQSLKSSKFKPQSTHFLNANFFNYYKFCLILILTFGNNVIQSSSIWWIRLVIFNLNV